MIEKTKHGRTDSPYYGLWTLHPGEESELQVSKMLTIKAKHFQHPEFGAQPGPESIKAIVEQEIEKASPRSRRLYGIYSFDSIIALIDFYQDFPTPGLSFVNLFVLDSNREANLSEITYILEKTALGQLWDPPESISEDDPYLTEDSLALAKLFSALGNRGSGKVEPESIPEIPSDESGQRTLMFRVTATSREFREHLVEAGYGHMNVGHGACLGRTFEQIECPNHPLL